jgi:predicted nucleic acid-binding protein
VTEAVLDASVVLKWIRPHGERHLLGARAFEAGELIVFAPPLLRLEIVNVAGRRWRFGESALLELALALEALAFELTEPELGRVAHWTACGLTAHDATWPSLRQSRHGS